MHRRKRGPIRAKTRPPEDEPQFEAGLFAHLSFAEIDRYEAMSAEEQEEFVERQRQLRASANRQKPTRSPSPSSQLVIPAEAGIQRDRDGGENHENTDRNTIIQNINAPLQTPHPAHPVNSQTHIRSP